jgi:hypothetical protein
MTARRPNRRLPAAAMIVAVAVSGCASEDSVANRRSGADRPYRGGAADMRPVPTSTTSSGGGDRETVAALAFFGAILIAIVGHADCSGLGSWPGPPPPPPPPPPPYGR